MNIVIAKYTEPEIVNGIKAKNQFVFEYFYDRFAPAFYGEIKRTIYQEEKAAEMLNKVFVDIWLDIDNYDFKQSLFTWCLRKVKKETAKQKIDMVLFELFSCEQRLNDTISHSRQSA